MGETSRRDLLKAAALAGAAGLAGCTSTPPSPAPVASSGGQGSIPGAGHWDKPPKQSGNQLNLIVLVSDTFRADNLEVYGSQWVETPALNRFAKDAVVFEQFYPRRILRHQELSTRRAIIA